MKLPLEMRHRIYGFASQRPHPNLILKEYLEKTDPDVGPPQVAAPAPAPVTQANGNEEEQEDSESEEQDPEGEAMKEDDQIDEPETQADDEIDEPETQEEDEDVAMTDVEEEESDEPDATADNTGANAAIKAPVTTSATVQNVSANAGEDEDEPENEDAEENEDEANEDEEEADDNEDEEAEDDSEEEEDEEDDGTVASVPQPARRREYTGRNTKYRHMLTTIKTRGCPPPIGLLLVNKEIYDEAMEYHYRTSFIKIDVTAAFAHQSFFEETLEKFTSNAFSPMERVRKVKITLTWDSEWLREKATPPDAELDGNWAFKHFLDERVDQAKKMLLQAPKVRHVEIDWHDTERTDKGQILMSEILMKFLSLESETWIDDTTEPPTQKNVDVTFREHISEAGTAHARNSLLAKRRTEFDEILASGMAFR